jgi:cytoskeletal protein RodZ
MTSIKSYNKNMKNHKQSHTKKFIIIGLVAVVVVSGGILTYANRQKVRDFLSSEQSTATDQNTAALEERGINDVDYGPSAPTDNEQINEQKKNADTPPPPTVSNGVVATITNTRVVNNLAQVSVLVEGATTGTCKLSLKGSAGQNVTKNTSVVLRGGLYTCEDFNIPVTELSSGTWNATIVIDVNGTSSAEATGTLQIGT